MITSSAALVGADYLRLSEYVPLHSFFQLRFSRVIQIREYDVQGVQFMEISMSADRRAGAAKAGPFPVIEALESTCWQALSGGSFR